MISLALATALGIAAAQSNPTIPSRDAFSACLSGFQKQSLAAKMDADAFDAAVQAQCAAQEAAFRNASVAYDVKMGSTRAQAQEDADFQVEDYLTMTKESYRVRAEAGRTPQAQ